MSPQTRLQGPLAWLGVLISWMVPGAGFMVCGRWARGIFHFLAINLTFALGLMLHSSVAWPTWSLRAEEFNLINNFTFLVEMGGGLAALASFVASAALEGESSAMQWLAGVPHDPYYELGTYFLVVAGALNYFAIGNFYDRVVNPHPRFDVKQDTEGTETA